MPLMSGISGHKPQNYEFALINNSSQKVQSYRLGSIYEVNRGFKPVL